MRARIAIIPDGRYHGRAFVDSDGVIDEPLTIDMRIEKSGTDLHSPSPRTHVHSEYLCYLCFLYRWCQRPPTPSEDVVMSRLSIEVTPEEVTPEQHQQLKAIAALHGQTLKDYILERTLPRLPPLESLSEEEALQRLETFLRPRLAEAEHGEVVEDSVERIFAAARRSPGE